MFFTSIFCGSLFCGSAVHILNERLIDGREGGQPVTGGHWC